MLTRCTATLPLRERRKKLYEEIEDTKVCLNESRGMRARKGSGEGEGCGRRWKTCQLSYSSPEFFVLQPARTKKEILFRFHRPSPPPSVFVCSPLAFPLVLSFSFSLIESSNFRLHSPSLPTGENSKDIVSKLRERESAEGCAAPGADSGMKERKRERGKNKELEQNARVELFLPRPGEVVSS